MSNALALAAVTAVLKDLMDNALIDHSVGAAVGGAITVSTLPPDRIETGESETARLNLFLYHVAPNAALRNLNLPSHDDRGRRRTNPPLALDLHYLLTAYRSQDFEAEILLGYAMLMIHDNPVLTRDAIRRTLAAPSPVGNGILPPAVGALTASDLAEQVELVKIVPQILSTEEISKLWTAFGAKFRPSVAYMATVVLIESQKPALSPLPVLSRGPVDPLTGKDRGVVVQPTLLSPFPALNAAEPPGGQPAVRMGDLLAISGRGLEGDEVVARFTHVPSGRGLELDAQAGATASAFEVRIPPDPPGVPPPPDSPLDPESWQAGIYAVRAVVRRAGEADRLTNALPVVLAPRIGPIAVAVGGGEITVTVGVSPPVRRTQRVRLLVGAQEVSPDPFAGDVADTLGFTSSAFPAGDQWVRLRVDDAESLLVDRSAVPPVFDATQRVFIP